MAYWILKVLLSPILRLVYRFDVSGTDHVPAEGAAILASNHQSFIDSIFIPLLVPRRVTFVAKAEYFESPKTAWFFRAMGQIPIKRGDGSAADRALASAREVLEAGGVLGIYPEGTRSPDRRLYKGHTGVARLALSTGAPVVPIALTGTPEVQPIGSNRPRLFRRVTVRIGAPLTWGGPPAVSLAATVSSAAAPAPPAAPAPAPPAAPAAAPGAASSPDDAELLRRMTDEIMDAIAALSGQERADDYAKRKRAGEVGRAAHHLRVVSAGSASGLPPFAPDGESNGPVASLKPSVHTEPLP